MVYNPARMDRNKKRKRAPHGGLSHNELLRRRRSPTKISSTKRENDVHGFRSQLFVCDEFEQYYQCIYAKNNTGFGVNKTGSKNMRVMQGSVFVTIGQVDDKNKVGEQHTNVYRSGDFISLPKGTGYALATGADSEVELLVTETSNYKKDWQPLGDILINTTSNNIFQVENPQGQKLRYHAHGRSDKSIAAAQKVAAQKQQHRRTGRRRNSQADNANSSTVMGVNPRPSGPPSDD